MKKTMIWILAIIVMLATSLAIYDLSMSDKGELIITELKAKIGNAAAQNNLGNMYATGEGVEQNYETAKGWYEKSAKQGYAAAQNNLGIMYANGEGVEQNYETAKGWYEKAAEQGLADAQVGLGYLYAKGKGVGQTTRPQGAGMKRRPNKGTHTRKTV